MADFILPTVSRPEDEAKRRLGGPVHAERHVRIICVGAGASGPAALVMTSSINIVLIGHFEIELLLLIFLLQVCLRCARSQLHMVFRA